MPEKVGRRLRASEIARASIFRLLTFRRNGGWNAWRAGIGNQQYSGFVPCFSPMHIVDRFANGLPLCDIGRNYCLLISVLG
jgi:hypothetical protein